jgi:sec-independent protein translocase protein TatA
MLTSVLQPTHLIIIVAVALLLLGPKRLPEAGRALGQGLKEFKNSISSTHEHDPQITTTPTTTHNDNPPRADAAQ